MFKDTIRNSFLGKPSSQKDKVKGRFFQRRTAVRAVFLFVYRKFKKPRRGLTRITPCEASKASGAWGTGELKTAPRERHIRSENALAAQ